MPTPADLAYENDSVAGKTHPELRTQMADNRPRFKPNRADLRRNMKPGHQAGRQLSRKAIAKLVSNYQRMAADPEVDKIRQERSVPGKPGAKKLKLVRTSPDVSQYKAVTDGHFYIIFTKMEDGNVETEFTYWPDGKRSALDKRRKTDIYWDADLTRARKGAERLVADAT